MLSLITLKKQRGIMILNKKASFEFESVAKFLFIIILIVLFLIIILFFKDVFFEKLTLVKDAFSK